MKLLQILLESLLPLLTRRVLAAERQAAACERQEDLLRAYLYFCHSEFRDQQLGILPEADPAEPNVDADHGPARDLKAARLAGIAGLFEEQFGSTPTDEQLVRMYEQMYEQDERQDPDQPAVRSLN